jgi:putative CocE/NonD family hydrolase
MNLRTMMLVVGPASFSLMVSSAWGDDGPAKADAGASSNFYLEKDVAVPMRDGVVLRADVYQPAASGRFPVLVFRTPYNKAPSNKDEVDLANDSTFRNAVKRGYAMVVQDVRGRYASEGEFVPYFNEAKDGYDTIEWAAAQPWSDGNVGSFGLSYPGAVQWLAAVETPPHLKAMVPAMCFSTMRQFIYWAMHLTPPNTICSMRGYGRLPEDTSRI